MKKSDRLALLSDSEIFIKKADKYVRKLLHKKCLNVPLSEKKKIIMLLIRSCDE